MSEDITAFVGLDVHKESIAIAVAEPGRAAPRFVGTTGPALAEVHKALSHLGTPRRLVVVYEAGPCGYGLARQLCSRGYRCEVIAPTKIPRKPGDRIKTDRRDALALAHFARAGDLTPVTIPQAADEAIRDLSRAREDAVRARLKARQQLKALLLRHGVRYTGKSSWTAAHERFLAAVSFEHAAQNIAFVEYRSAVSEAHERVERLTTALRGQAAEWRLQPVVGALMTLRGIDLVAAVTLVAELGDLKRLDHPKLAERCRRPELRGRLHRRGSRIVLAFHTVKQSAPTGANANGSAHVRISVPSHSGWHRVVAGGNRRGCRPGVRLRHHIAKATAGQCTGARGPAGRGAETSTRRDHQDIASQSRYRPVQQ